MQFFSNTGKCQTQCVKHSWIWNRFLLILFAYQSAIPGFIMKSTAKTRLTVKTELDLSPWPFHESQEKRKHTITPQLFIVSLKFWPMKQCQRKKWSTGTSLVVQWLGFHASTAGGTGLTPDEGTKILRATQYGQKNKEKNKWSTVRS